MTVHERTQVGSSAPNGRPLLSHLLVLGGIDSVCIENRSRLTASAARAGMWRRPRWTCFARRSATLNLISGYALAKPCPFLGQFTKAEFKVFVEKVSVTGNQCPIQ